MARMAEGMSDGHLTVRAFTDIDSAWEWLTT
jgi:hypothetical protein